MAFFIYENFIQAPPAAGASWRRCDAIDLLPTRAQWTFPGPPHEPHVLSIDFLINGSTAVVAGVEVGGVEAVEVGRGHRSTRTR